MTDPPRLRLYEHDMIPVSMLDEEQLEFVFERADLFTYRTIFMDVFTLPDN